MRAPSNKSLFRLYVVNISVLTAFFVVFAISLVLVLRSLMLPYYYDELNKRVYESVEKRESILASLFLQGGALEVQRIVDRPNFIDMPHKKRLHEYSTVKYKRYSLLSTCEGSFQAYAWGSTCRSDGTYLIEVPIRSADNTLAHLIVELTPDIDAWRPYKIVKTSIVAYLIISMVSALFLVLTFYYRYARPIRGQIAALTQDHESVDYAKLKKNLPINECLQLTVQLERYHGLATKNMMMAAVGDISSHIAHDMRSPLAVLKSYIAVSPTVDDFDAKELRGAAVRSVDKLQGMADDLVDYAKARAIERKDCDIGRIVREGVIAETRGKADKRNVDVSCIAGEGMQANLDAAKIERVLVNLVHNAIQAHSTGSGRIVVNAEATDDASLVLKVEDTGTGIAEEDLPHVFDSLFTKGKRGGTGLGLAYCKQVVEAHGGTIQVASEVGKGTVFTITLPHCVVKGVKP